MQIGELTLDNMLATIVEQPAIKSKYTIKTNIQSNSPIYKITHTGIDAKHEVGNLVMLLPRAGQTIKFNDTEYIQFTNENVLCNVVEGKE